MSESTVKAQQCLRAFVDGNYEQSLSLIDQVEEPHKLTDDKCGATLLHWAAAKGWLNIVQQLLQKYHFDPICKSNIGSTPLHFANESGQLNVVQYLITDHECKCDPMCTNDCGGTSLHYASSSGNLALVQYLITECKCSPMCKDNNGHTPLHWASNNGHLNIIQYLITECKSDTMCSSECGDTPLHLASCNGHLNVVQYLTTECKCDSECKNENGDTPLILSSCNGHLDVVQYLVTECKIDPMCKTDRGDTTLHLASYNGHLNVVQYLTTEHNCNPICRGNEGSTPLHLASFKGHLDVVKYLITECKCDPLHERRNDGYTSLHFASDSGHLLVIDYLINHCKCDPMCKTDNDSTPLLLASYNGHLTVVQYLVIECKCDPMHKRDDETIPLHSACEKGHLSVVQFLIAECKCDPMSRRIDGASPLDLASGEGHLDIVKYLINECKCDPMCKADNGATPLHWASIDGRLSVVQYLIEECKCDPKGITFSTFTPLHLAFMFSQPHVVEYLLSTGKVNPHATNSSLGLKGKVLLDGKRCPELRNVFSKLKTCISADSYVNVFLLGNPGAGKSTLAQVIIQTSSGRQLLGRFKTIEQVKLHTAGIVPTRIEHQRLGNIILNDLAGQPEYYSSHNAVLENLLQDHPAVFINIVNLCEQETLKSSLHKWISVIENVSQNVSSPCHVLTVGSHIDMITRVEFSQIENELWKILSSRLESANVTFSKLIGLDCRKLGGGEFSSFINTLSKCCQAIRSAISINTSLHCRMLYAFLEDEGEIVHRVDKLCTVITARNISESYYVPNEQEEILETLSILHSIGLITFLKNERTTDKSWVIVDKSALLKDVNGVLFAPSTFEEYLDMSSNTGIITQSALTKIFSKYDSEMIIHFLCYMKLSMEITSDMIIHTNLQRKPTDDSKHEEKYLFIPALIRDVQRPTGMDGIIQFGWCLQCSNPHQFFLPRFHHVLQLHLAYQYAIPKTADNPHHRRCTIWTNGIIWSDDGVQTLVEIDESSQCVLLLMSSKLESKNIAVDRREKVIKDILSHRKDICPRLELTEFIIDPSQLQYPIDKPSTLMLYDIEHVASCVIERKTFAIPYNSEGSIGTKISDLLPFERINPNTLSVFAGRSPETLTNEYNPVEYRSQNRSRDHSRNILDISDLDVVKESVKEIVDWQDLGLRLGLLHSTLEKIETEQNRVEKCKREMLAAWLHGEDNSKDRTWSTLVDALQGMENHLLADNITEQHLK